MCNQLTKLLEEMKERLRCLNSDADSSDRKWNLDPIDEYYRGKQEGRIEELEDIIKIVESMLATSNCKGNHLG